MRFGDLHVLPGERGRVWFLDSCPFALLQSPATEQVMEAHIWWEKGQLGIRYPAGIPLIMIRAIRDYELGRKRGEYDKAERERNKIKASSG